MNITLEVLIHSALSALTILGITNFANNVFVCIYIFFTYVEMYAELKVMYHISNQDPHDSSTL